MKLLKRYALAIYGGGRRRCLIRYRDPGKGQCASAQWGLDESKAQSWATRAGIDAFKADRPWLGGRVVIIHVEPKERKSVKPCALPPGGNGDFTPEQLARLHSGDLA